MYLIVFLDQTLVSGIRPLSWPFFDSKLLMLFQVILLLFYTVLEFGKIVIKHCQENRFLVSSHCLICAKMFQAILVVLKTVLAVIISCAKIKKKEFC